MIQRSHSATHVISSLSVALGWTQHQINNCSVDALCLSRLSVVLILTLSYLLIQWRCLVKAHFT